MIIPLIRNIISGEKIGHLCVGLRFSNPQLTVVPTTPG